MATSTVDRQQPREHQPLILRVASDAWSWSKIPVMEVVETLSSSYVGQMVLKFADKFLWVVEKSSQWALPPPEAPANDKMVVTELTRPLPWLLFLPTLFWLRIFREMMSFCALMMGMEPIRPSSIVRFIQNCRKSLRSIKYNGIRNLRTKNAIRPEEHVGIESWFFWIIIKIQSMLCYNAVVYEHAPHKNLTVRKNSGEKIVVTLKKKSPSKENVDEAEHQPHPEQQHQNEVEVEDFDASIFKKLVQDLEEFIDSDDDDFSVGEDAEDTSATSVDDEDEGYYQPEDDQYKNDKHHQNEKAKPSEIPIKKADEVAKKTEILKIVENGNQKEGSLTNGSSELKNLNVTGKSLLNNEVAAGSSQPPKEPKEEDEKAAEEKTANSCPTAKRLNRDRKNNRFNPRISRKGVLSSTKSKTGQSTIKSTVEQTVVKNSSVETSVVEQSNISSTVQEISVTSPPTTGQSSEKSSTVKQSLNKSSTVEQSSGKREGSPKKTSTPESGKKEKPKETQPNQNDANRSLSELQKINTKSPNKENLKSTEKQKENSDGNQKTDSGNAISKDIH